MSCWDRRKFLACGLTLPAAALIAKTAVAECVDPDELSSSAQSMRDSLEYTDAAPDPSQACKACNYFQHAKPDETCGQCSILGSPVSVKGHCNSWTKRAS